MSSTEYVYLVAKPIGREAELIKAESVIVTGAKPSELGVTTSETLADIKQGAFISSVIKVLISGDSESIDNQIGSPRHVTCFIPNNNRWVLNISDSIL